jgi:Short C-terminal domain
VIGNNNLDSLVTGAPVNFGAAKVDWAGVSEALRSAEVEPDLVLAATWCSFGERNIEAEVDSTQLTLVHPFGILSSVGKRKMFGGTVKYDVIDFGAVRAYGPAETADERGFGKYCIEFAGAGDMLLGRLQWGWSAKRFRDNRAEIMRVAEERDRILNIVTSVLEGPAVSNTLSLSSEESVQTLDLDHLADLHERGVLTDEEFAAAKKKALGI